MVGLEVFALQRQNQLLSSRLDMVEQVLAESGILDSVLGLGGVPGIPRPGDPGPSDISRFGGFTAFRRVVPGVGPIPDPAVSDITRLNRVQLQAMLHNIAAERARLDGMEKLVNDQLAGSAPSQ